MNLTRASDKGLLEICKQHTKMLADIYKEIRQRAIKEQHLEEYTLIKQPKNTL